MQIVVLTYDDWCCFQLEYELMTSTNRPARTRPENAAIVAMMTGADQLLSRSTSPSSAKVMPFDTVE